MKNAKQKVGVVFYVSFYEAIKQLSSKHRLIMYDAILGYGIDEEEPINIPPKLKGLLELIKPQLDASKRKYANACLGGKYGQMGASAGTKGGRPRKNLDLKSSEFDDDPEAK